MAELLNHAIHRLMERTEQEVPRREILNAIECRQMVFAKKMTATRSLVYTLTPKGVVKIILYKPSNKVVTVLPWRGCYQKLLEFTTEDGFFKAEIYPDCYLETNCRTALTKIIRIHGDGAKEPIAFNHPLFDKAFDAAWEIYRKEENAKTQTQTEDRKPSKREGLLTNINDYVSIDQSPQRG